MYRIYLSFILLMWSVPHLTPRSHKASAFYSDVSSALHSAYRTHLFVELFLPYSLPKFWPQLPFDIVRHTSYSKHHQKFVFFQKSYIFVFSRLVQFSDSLNRSFFTVNRIPSMTIDFIHILLKLCSVKSFLPVRFFKNASFSHFIFLA